MISGLVDARLEARIAVYIEDDTGQCQNVDAVIDTGFSGFLCLPPSQVASLALPWVCRQPTKLADGTIQMLDEYAAIVIWDTQPRNILVVAANTDPLVGMKLLEGNELRMRVVPGGFIWIDAVP
ncbi:MAG TPA: hypothetical protein VE988_17240 [Gemmataceae bacterium]|nr:hypothetical protein [Gemmataceae bacterium]